MLNIFGKSFHLCFSKLKSEHESSILPPSPATQDDFTSAATTLLLLKNFNNSLYDMSHHQPPQPTSPFLTPSTDTDFPSSDSDSELLPDFATIFASQCFFFSSPGRSNSIIESPDAGPEAEFISKTPASPDGGGIAVKKYSSNPYKDFRFSMQEMIQTRNLTDMKKDWEFLHELLLC